MNKPQWNIIVYVTPTVFKLVSLHIIYIYDTRAGGYFFDAQWFENGFERKKN